MRLPLLCNLMSMVAQIGALVIIKSIAYSAVPIHWTVCTIRQSNNEKTQFSFPMLLSLHCSMLPSHRHDVLSKSVFNRHSDKLECRSISSIEMGPSLEIFTAHITSISSSLFIQDCSIAPSLINAVRKLLDCGGKTASARY